MFLPSYFVYWFHGTCHFDINLTILCIFIHSSVEYFMQLSLSIISLQIVLPSSMSTCTSSKKIKNNKKCFIYIVTVIVKIGYHLLCTRPTFCLLATISSSCPSLSKTHRISVTCFSLHILYYPVSQSSFLSLASISFKLCSNGHLQLRYNSTVTVYVLKFSSIMHSCTQYQTLAINLNG